MTQEETLAKIDQQVKNNPVVIYMKGTPTMPSCGYSSRAVQALIDTGERFAFVNVLADQDIFQHLPAYADWPTFPQVYAGGELIGGCDIALELHAQGELARLMKAANEKHQAQAEAEGDKA
jgi:monothiol glutaredoxin